MDLVTLRSGDLEATFAPGAGMIGSSLRHRGAELLGQREGLDAYVDRASTFGIPLLHPWANRLDGMSYAAAGKEVTLDADRSPIHYEENHLPIHGLCAACPYWEVTRREEALLAARLDFAAHDELMAGFPFAHRLEMEVTLEPGALNVLTTLTATGEDRVPVSFGFHPYLTLPGVERADFAIDLPVRAHGVLNERSIPTGEVEPADIPAAPLGDRTFDDLYPELADPAEFVLAGGGRRVAVRYDEGYPLAQVYAPEGEAFICFEPMTAPTNALQSGDRLPVVGPGESYAARFSMLVGSAEESP